MRKACETIGLGLLTLGVVIVEAPALILFLLMAPGTRKLRVNL